MPYLCNLDYVMFGIVGAPLFREYTCMDEGRIPCAAAILTKSEKDKTL